MEHITRSVCSSRVGVTGRETCQVRSVPAALTLSRRKYGHECPGYRREFGTMLPTWRNMLSFSLLMRLLMIVERGHGLTTLPSVKGTFLF